MSYDLYPATSMASPATRSGLSLYPVISGAKEIDLRLEFRRFLYGHGREIPKGQRGLLRRMRRDDDGALVVCSCVDEITREPDKDTKCPYCLGEGYLWDEEWITFYKVIVSSNEGLVRKDRKEKAGVANIPYAFFYVEHHVDPTRYDKIVEVERDLDGSAAIPYRRTAVFDIATAQPFRSDRGRVEYWRLATVQDSVKSTWQG